MTEISVIIPIYRVEPYLRRCVDSILAQTFTDFELILVDDGSPDNCGAICDAYAAKDSRIHVIHQENGGLSAARNAGIDWAFAHSDSRWLSFVDSDDWVHPRMLEALYNAACSHHVEVSVCGYRETEGSDPWEEGELSSKLWPVKQYYVQHNINATIAVCKLYQKDCFNEIRYPVGKIHEDEYVTYRILFEYNHIAVIEAPMYAYYMNAQGIMRSTWRIKRLDAIGALEEQIAYFDEHNMSALRDWRIDMYMRILCGQKKRIIDGASEEEKPKAIRYVNRKLRKGLLKYYAMFPFEEKWWFIYESAYPVLMNTYWRLCSAKNKLMKMLEKNG